MGERIVLVLESQRLLRGEKGRFIHGDVATDSGTYVFFCASVNPKKSSPRKVQSSSQSSSSSTIANTSAGDSTSGTSVDADIQVREGCR